MAMKVVRQARLELSGGSTPDQLRPPTCPVPPPCPPPPRGGGGSLASSKTKRTSVTLHRTATVGGGRIGQAPPFGVGDLINPQPLEDLKLRALSPTLARPQMALWIRDGWERIPDEALKSATIAAYFANALWDRKRKFYTVPVQQ